MRFKWRVTALQNELHGMHMEVESHVLLILMMEMISKKFELIKIVLVISTQAWKNDVSISKILIILIPFQT